MGGAGIDRADRLTADREDGSLGRLERVGGGHDPSREYPHASADPIIADAAPSRIWAPRSASSRWVRSVAYVSTPALAYASFPAVPSRWKWVWIMLLSSSHRTGAHAFFERVGFISDKKRGFVKYLPGRRP